MAEHTGTVALRFDASFHIFYKAGMDKGSDLVQMTGPMMVYHAGLAGNIASSAEAMSKRLSPHILDASR